MCAQRGIHSLTHKKSLGREIEVEQGAANRLGARRLCFNAFPHLRWRPQRGQKRDGDWFDAFGDYDHSTTFFFATVLWFILVYFLLQCETNGSTMVWVCERYTWSAP